MLFMGFYASSFWYSMGHARLCGGVIILLASYFRYLEFYSKLFDTLMWIVWLEQNRCSFEDIKKKLEQLKVLCQRSIFYWSQCWGFMDCFSLSEFMFSLRITSWFLFLCCLFMLSYVNHHEQLVFFLSLFINKITLIIYQNVYIMSQNPNAKEYSQSSYGNIQ